MEPGAAGLSGRNEEFGPEPLSSGRPPHVQVIPHTRGNLEQEPTQENRDPRPHEPEQGRRHPFAHGKPGHRPESPPTREAAQLADQRIGKCLNPGRKSSKVIQDCTICVSCRWTGPCRKSGKTGHEWRGLPRPRRLVTEGPGSPPRAGPGKQGRSGRIGRPTCRSAAPTRSSGESFPTGRKPGVRQPCLLLHTRPRSLGPGWGRTRRTSASFSARPTSYHNLGCRQTWGLSTGPLSLASAVAQVPRASLRYRSMDPPGGRITKSVRIFTAQHWYSGHSRTACSVLAVSVNATKGRTSLFSGDSNCSRMEVTASP